MRTTSIRFTGLASGLDTESIVQSMVMPYKMKVDTKWQQQKLMEMQKDAWRDMNKQIFNFHDKYIGKMRLESTFNKKSISVSNPNAITIDKNSNLPTGTHKIDSITQLAEGASVKTISISKKSSDKLVDLGIEFEKDPDNEGKYLNKKIQINGKEVTVSQSDTIGSLTKKMQQATPDLNISFDDKAQAFFISSKKTGESQSIILNGKDQDLWGKLGIQTKAQDKTEEAALLELKLIKEKNAEGKEVEVLESDVTVQINGKDILFKKGDTVEIITKKLHDSLDTEAHQARVEYKNGKFIVSQQDGQPMTATIDGVAQETVSMYTGKNAVVSYNGVKVTSETNNISVNGLNFTINTTTNEGITLVSTQDTDAIVDFMKEFVDEYNKLIEDIHTKLGASSSKGYAPLTDEQKKEMSDSEIEAWEKRITDGIFRNDSDLKKVTDTMRQIFSGTVEGGVFSSFSEIGITTGDWKENGKLHFDEDKFKAALAKDTDGVVQLIAGSGDAASIYEKDVQAGKIEAIKDDKGNEMSWEEILKSDKADHKALVSKYQNRTNSIGDKLYNTITEMTRSTTSRSAYSFYNDKALDKKISTAKDDVSKLEERMIRMEDMYYKKFTAMEKMMQQLNNQSNWLMSQMG